MKNTKKSWVIPVLMLAIIVGPLFFAWMLIQKGDIHQFKLKHHGTLIAPYPNIEKSVFQDKLSNETTPGKKLLGHWWFFYVLPQKCNQECESIFYNLGQIRKALGKDTSRVQRLFVIEKNVSNEQAITEFLLKNHSNATLYTLDGREYNKLFGAINPTPSRMETGEIYLVDPKGNIMMQYSAATPPKDMLSDVKRLLRISKNG